MPKDNCEQKKKCRTHENAPIIKIRSGYGRVELQCETQTPTADISSLCFNIKTYKYWCKQMYVHLSEIEILIIENIIAMEIHSEAKLYQWVENCKHLWAWAWGWGFIHFIYSDNPFFLYASIIWSCKRCIHW